MKNLYLIITILLSGVLVLAKPLSKEVLNKEVKKFKVQATPITPKKELKKIKNSLLTAAKKGKCKALLSHKEPGTFPVAFSSYELLVIYYESVKTLELFKKESSDLSYSVYRGSSDHVVVSWCNES